MSEPNVDEIREALALALHPRHAVCLHCGDVLWVGVECVFERDDAKAAVLAHGLICPNDPRNARLELLEQVAKDAAAFIVRVDAFEATFHVGNRVRIFIEPERVALRKSLDTAEVK